MSQLKWGLLLQKTNCKFEIDFTEKFCEIDFILKKKYDYEKLTISLNVLSKIVKMLSLKNVYWLK